MALSKVVGVYRLSQEPELKHLNSGSAVCKLNLVNSGKYKTQAGEQREDTCFIEGTCFSGLAKIASQYLRKGSKIYVVAELKQETWQDQNGQNRSKHSLKIESFEMLDSKPNDNQSQQQQQYPQNYNRPQDHRTYREPAKMPDKNSLPEIDADMEIPF